MSLIICKSTNENIFGGYCQLPWRDEQHLDQQHLNRSFIFSIVNKKILPVKLVRHRYNGINRTSYGPSFGIKCLGINFDLSINLEGRCHSI